MSTLPNSVRADVSRRSAASRTNRSAIARVGVWLLVLIAGALAGGSYAYFTRPHTATVRLTTYEKSFSNPSEASDFVSTALSTSVLARVAAKLTNSQPQDFSKTCRVSLEGGGSAILVTATGPSEIAARKTADALAASVMEWAMEWAGKRSKEMDRQISAAQKRLGDLRKQFSDFDEALLSTDVRNVRQTLAQDASAKQAATSALEAQVAAINSDEKKTIAALSVEKPMLKTLQQELEQALTRYTEEHPKVKELRAAMVALQKESASKTNRPSAKSNVQLAELNSKRLSAREQLKKAQSAEQKSVRALQKFATNEVEFVKLQSEYTALSTRRDELVAARVSVSSKSIEKWRRADHPELGRLSSGDRVPVFAAAGFGIGVCAMLVAAPLTRRKKKIIRDEQTLSEAAGLPVLASLRNLEGMTAKQREFWGVETLELLRRTAGIGRRGCFILGVTSARPGEGRSTFLELLADAGLKHGNRVLLISRPGAEQAPLQPEETSAQSNRFLVPLSQPTGTQALARYEFPENIDHVHFQKNWERALAAWQLEENAVVLVELPAAESADALLLAGVVPNVVWLSTQGVSETSTTTQCVESLRNTGCNLIGATLNMSTANSRLAGSAVAIGLLASLIAMNASAQQPVRRAPAAETNILSGTSARVLAPWQQKLTLGPGDVLSVSLYGQADSARSVIVGSDGRINFLQATDVPTAGLTVDELRTRLEDSLKEFHLSPRAVVSPVTYASKKYYLLGNVNQRGAFVLDRPTTVLEAVAKARGFVVRTQQRHSFVLADLPHAFLVRKQPNGEYDREPVDFEGLFTRGELQHNKLLAPDDYLYFPPLGLEEVYTLGEVQSPGLTAYAKDLSVLGAIASRGGFTEGAFRQKILVVRGSLDNPETFIVDVASALRGASPDFALQPRDIVYVSRKPWAKAEELLKAAASDFVRAAAVEWTGQQIGPIFR